MAKALTFADNLVDYEINGVPVRFNPTDEDFAQKLYEAFGTLDGLQEGFADGDDFSKFRELDGDMRTTIDGLLGEGKADKLFPNMNCYALADGLPVWLNLMLALLDEVTEAFEKEFGKTDARVKAQNAKYNKMLAKYRKGKGK